MPGLRQLAEKASSERHGVKPDQRGQGRWLLVIPRSNESCSPTCTALPAPVPSQRSLPSAPQSCSAGGAPVKRMSISIGSCTKCGGTLQALEGVSKLLPAATSPPRLTWDRSPAVAPTRRAALGHTCKHGSRTHKQVVQQCAAAQVEAAAPGSRVCCLHLPLTRRQA